MSLVAGGPAPWFTAATPQNPTFAFGSLGGRYVALAFLPLPGPEREAALAAIRARKDQFASLERVIFHVIPDAASMATVERVDPGVEWFDDTAGEIRRLYDAEGPDGAVIPRMVVLDPTLRVLAIVSLADGPALLDRVAAMGPPERHAGVPVNAPILIVPRILEADLCRRLIAHYDADGGQPSGFMVQKDGRTVGMLSDFKRRNDAQITDQALRQELRARLIRRLLPEIEKAFQFRTTHIERYIVARYSADEGGYFRPHRDNTTSATAHRRFAVTINLNAEDYEGGDLRLPEYGDRLYRAPTGGAVVFSCSLLHEAMPVTRGARYATLPFLYDEAGDATRKANAHLLDLPDQARTPETADAG